MWGLSPVGSDGSSGGARASTSVGTVGATSQEERKVAKILVEREGGPSGSGTVCELVPEQRARTVNSAKNGL